MFLIILNVIFFLAFVVFAWFNLNDKDATVWVTIYLAAAICCALAAFQIFLPAVYLVLIFIYLVYAIFLFFSKDGVQDWIIKYNRPSIAESMQATKPYIEKTREFFGLLIMSTALVINYFAGG